MYRAAFVPALLAAVLVMFSLQDRPRPLPQGLAADVLFDGRLATARADAIATENPTRTAGSRGDRARPPLGGKRPRRPRLSGWSGTRFTHAGRQLVNVIGRRAGRTRRQIVVVAERDAAVDAGRDRAAPRTRRRCSSWRGCSRAGPRARRSCSPRSTARPSERWARPASRRRSEIRRRWTPSRRVRPCLAHAPRARTCRPGRTTPAAPVSRSNAPWRTRSARS